MPFAKVPQVATHPPTYTRGRSILRPMCCQATIQPQDLLSRVVIQTPNASSSTLTMPSIKENYKPVKQRTRSKVPHTMDPPPPRVNKSTYLRSFFRRTRSQNTATANVITPAPANKRQYPARFLKSMEIPVLEKPPHNYYNTVNSPSTRSLRTYLTHPTPMKSDNYAKESAKDKRSPRINEWEAQTSSASLDFKIYLETEENKISTPWFCVRLDLKSNIPIRYASPSLIAASPILATKTRPQVPSTFSIS